MAGHRDAFEVGRQRKTSASRSKPKRLDRLRPSPDIRREQSRIDVKLSLRRNDNLRLRSGDDALRIILARAA
jgi:hypothetical protein